MTLRWERAQSDGTHEAWAQLIGPLAPELADHADSLAEQVVARAQVDLPDLVSGPDGWQLLHDALAAGARAMAARLERGDDPATVELPPETLDLLRDSAHRGVPLIPLTRLYRLGYSVLWAGAITRLTARASDREELGLAAELASDWLLTYLDNAQTIAESTYQAERERWLRSSAASCANTLEAILSDRQTDEALASQRLRHDLRMNHVAIVGWADGGGTEASLARLEHMLAELAALANPDGVLVHPLGLSTRAAWMSRRRPFEEPDLNALTLDAGADHGVRFAVGTPHSGIEGFRRTHEEALEARRVAMLAARRPGTVTRYAAVALAALGTVDLDQARAFVDAQLGELAAGDDVSLRLAATLRVYFDENASPTRTARRLGIHENTVANRVRQAEQRIGRPLTDHRLELHVALALAPLVR